MDQHELPDGLRSGALRLSLTVNYDVSRARDGSLWDADLWINGTRQNAQLRRVDPVRYQAFLVKGLEGAFILETSPHRD